MVNYDRLWKTMKRKGISQYKLIRAYHFSAGQINRLKKNMYVSTRTINNLCRILDCDVADIMEYVPDETMTQEMKRILEESREH